MKNYAMTSFGDFSLQRRSGQFYLFRDLCLIITSIDFIIAFVIDYCRDQKTRKLEVLFIVTKWEKNQQPNLSRNGHLR